MLEPAQLHVRPTARFRALNSCSFQLTSMGHASLLLELCNAGFWLVRIECQEPDAAAVGSGFFGHFRAHLKRSAARGRTALTPSRNGAGRFAHGRVKGTRFVRRAA